jgi:Brp/Blh family beta-carotene 15,15'-monooxygenase
MSQLTRYSGIALSLAYLLLISFWKTMPIQVEWGFCIFLLALLGIPHGAADHLVSKCLAERENKSFKLVNFIGYYVMVMLIYGIVWYYFRLFSFIVFIGISVFHFGDLETTQTPTSKLFGIHYLIEICRALILGTGILGYILSNHAQEVSSILVNFKLGIEIPFNGLPNRFYLICILLGYQKEHQSFFINTGITLFIGSYLPILPAFICYFAGCHSVYSLRVLTSSLQVSLGQLYLKLLPFTTLAIVMGTAYVILVSPDKWLAHTFIFLSILTLPHFFLMHQIIPKRP